jgi:hypothetical protein
MYEIFSYLAVNTLNCRCKDNVLMLFKEISVVRSQSDRRHTNTPYERSAEVFDVKATGVL